MPASRSEVECGAGIGTSAERTTPLLSSSHARLLSQGFASSASLPPLRVRSFAFPCLVVAKVAADALRARRIAHISAVGMRDKTEAHFSLFLGCRKSRNRSRADAPFDGEPMHGLDCDARFAALLKHESKGTFQREAIEAIARSTSVIRLLRGKRHNRLASSPPPHSSPGGDVRRASPDRRARNLRRSRSR